MRPRRTSCRYCLADVIQVFVPQTRSWTVIDETPVPVTERTKRNGLVFTKDRGWHPWRESSATQMHMVHPCAHVEHLRRADEIDPIGADLTPFVDIEDELLAAQTLVNSLRKGIA